MFQAEVMLTTSSRLGTRATTSLINSELMAIMTLAAAIDTNPLPHIHLQIARVFETPVTAIFYASFCK